MADRLTAEQAAAVRPSRSAWISANAGSGKTRVLTNRVARCLLEGVRPDRILCLTYTRAAAGEMKSRLFETLGRWAMCPDEMLRHDLHGLLDSGEQVHFDARSLASARRLFAQALEYPGGLKIQTIHSFGLSLLRRFPREAGLNPGVSILDERRAETLKTEAFDETLREAQSDDGSLGTAYRSFVVEGRLSTLETLRDAVLQHRSAYRAFAAMHGGTVQSDAIRGFLGDADGTAESDGLVAMATVRTQVDGLERVAALLQELGKPREQDRIPHILRAVRTMRAGEESQAIRHLRRGLLNRNGARPKRLFTNSVTAAMESKGLLNCVHSVWDALDDIEAARRIAAVSDASISAARIASAFLDRYAAAKRAEAALDYEDVIEHVSALLNRSEAREWIRYRLDGGIDHILVDEAQDTSPAQWETLKRLSEEFFAGETAVTRNRTIFAVGDEKQSIFSFQGAAPEEFTASREWFQTRMETRGETLFTGALQMSFRSSPAILQFVDAVFHPESYVSGDRDEGEVDGLGHWADSLVGFGQPLSHQSFHSRRPGRVEVWDLFDPSATDSESPGSGAEIPPEKFVARRIAERIASWIGEAVPLPGSERPIRPNDIMVLVQRRGVFTDELVRCLRLNRVPVAGADRIGLVGHIAVQDLLALAAFALLPEDDFTLAVLLRSPFCDIAEDELFTLAWNRGGRSLLARLRVAAAEGSERLRAALAFLMDMRDTAERHGPYEFLERALTFHNGRRKLLERLGEDAIEPIDALLAEAIAFQNRERGSLEEFLWRTRSGETYVKADASSGPAAVRIMTIHGAKGLEAPVVIVPDANRMPNFAARERVFIGRAANGCPIPLFVRRSGDDTPETEDLRRQRQRKELEESYRLFYVALTRAEKWLIVCGSKWRRKSSSATASRGANARCWQFRAEAAAERIGRRIVEDRDRRRLGILFPGHLLESGDNTSGGMRQTVETSDTGRIVLPEWTSLPVAMEDLQANWTAASGLGTILSESKSAREWPHSLQSDGRAALERGTLTHLLLERLAGMTPGDARDARARGLAGQFGGSLPEDDREQVLDQVARILDHPELGELFRAEGLAEPWVALRMPGAAGGVWGRIDRLVLDGNRALILDFKGDPEPPETPETTGKTYLAQLGAYRRAVCDIYPSRTVSASILWTSAEPPRLMPIPDRLADTAFLEAVVAMEQSRDEH